MDKVSVDAADHLRSSWGCRRLPLIDSNYFTDAINYGADCARIHWIEAKMIGKNRQKTAFTAGERRKLRLRVYKKPKKGHFYLSKVPASQ